MYLIVPFSVKGEVARGVDKHRCLDSGECSGWLVRDLNGMRLEDIRQINLRKRHVLDLWE